MCKLSILFTPFKEYIVLFIVKTQIGIIVVGAIIVIFGTIFQFQGKAVIGPQSSFMYSNPEWIAYGIWIAIIGIVIIGFGASLKFLRKT